MLEADIELNNVQAAGSHSRNLLILKRVTEVVKVLFGKILGWVAYSTVFGNQHEHGLQIRLSRLLPNIPSKAQLSSQIMKEENAELIETTPTGTCAVCVVGGERNGLRNLIGIELSRY
ncbi:hypothetical protein MKX01_030951 [Papaver californicum]|nr:hypothetical protein MKX01_030951 [Papaver californicum]